MNTSLFKSIHFFIAAAISAACIAWLFAIDAAPGARAGSDVTYVLWSGWIAFALMMVVMLYCARKYMHKLGYSPELRRRVPMDILERTDSRLNEIRRKIVQGFLTTEKEIEDLANRAVKEEGAARVVRIEVHKGEPGGPAFELLARPPEPFFTMASWLHSHAYYGLASGVLVWLHGGFAMESPLGVAMNVLTYLVIVTGVLGWFLFAYGPTWMSRTETDLNFEETFVLSSSLGEKIDAVYEKFEDEPELLARIKKAAKARDVDGALAETVSVAVAEKPEAKTLLEDVSVLIAQRSRMRRGLGTLSRIKFWMNIWRAVHVPASLLLMGVVVLHIISVWWY